MKQFFALWGTFLPMCTLFFFMAFINTIMDSLKDTFVITAVGGGAQVIPYLTVYAVFPVSLLFVLAYTYASQHFDRSKLFNWIVVMFGVFNLSFALFLYPNHRSLHLYGLGEMMAQNLPVGLDGLIGMLQNWTFTLFYCMSELWGDVGLSLLFWGFANEITKMENAPLLYPLFGIGANLAQTLAGLVLKFFSGLGSGEAAFATSLAKLMWMVMLCKGIVIVLHFWIERNSTDLRKQEKQQRQIAAAERPSHGPLLPGDRTESRQRMRSDKMDAAMPNLGNGHSSSQSDRSQLHPASSALDEGGGHDDRVGDTVHMEASTSSEIEGTNGSGTPAEDTPRSIKEVLKILGQSPHIRALAVMMVAQSFAVNVMEFVWKSHVGLVYPTPAAFTGFMGDVATATGIVTGSLMFLSPIMFERLGWTGVAGVTPKVLSYGGGAFFLSCFAYHAFTRMGALAWGTAVLPAVAFGGAALFVLARGAKFSLFKPAEEMVYICLDEDSRTKGKAAVDVVGAQFGKSAGSISQQVLLLLSSGALFGIIPVIFGMYMLTLREWNKAVDDLSAFQAVEDPESPAPGDGPQGSTNGNGAHRGKRDIDPNAPPALAGSIS
ncbi:unnamed protein product [Ostreobium quekettii]|uniref:ADP,ATP carrier protein n=1 Tax=Ostreobium quekettii TaxID=121088 RepID=A0A8S1ISH9_9CHLO|nr:unnamed protein product [Ostreobium quekettii]